MFRSALPILFFAFAAVAGEPEDLLREATVAHEARNYAAEITALQKLERLRPKYPTALVRLSRAYALSGDPDKAFAALDRLVAMRVAFSTANHDYDPIRQDPRFTAVANAIDALMKERVKGADVAFHIPEKGLITEGLAWDAAGRRFLVSSVRKGKIVQIDEKGSVSDFTKSRDPQTFSLSGIGIDAKRRLVWACTANSPRFEGTAEGAPPQASLVAFRLSDGTLAKRVALPADAFCDDLTVASNGTVYVSDSTGSVLRVTDKASVLVPKGSIRSPQGSTLSANEKSLYVADYGGPIRRVDVRTGAVMPLQLPEDFQPMGIDGLARHDNTLIAVQNGILPNRIVALDLAPDGNRVTAWRILEMNHEQIDEPTIGKVLGSTYYFVGASQGHLFDEPHPPAPTQLTEGLIFRIPLR